MTSRCWTWTSQQCGTSSTLSRPGHQNFRFRLLWSFISSLFRGWRDIYWPVVLHSVVVCLFVVFFFLFFVVFFLLYEGHSLCFAIWFFNNTYNHSVSSSFSKKPPSACTHLTILSNPLSMTPDHVDWGMPKTTPSKNARASLTF